MQSDEAIYAQLVYVQAHRYIYVYAHLSTNQVQDPPVHSLDIDVWDCYISVQIAKVKIQICQYQLFCQKLDFHWGCPLLDFNFGTQRSDAEIEVDVDV